MYCRDAFEKKITSKKKTSKPKKMKKSVPIGDVSIASSCHYIFIYIACTECFLIPDDVVDRQKLGF